MQARKPGNAIGVDVSHWQGKIDWLKVRDAGYSFAICKATEGSTMPDDTFTANITGAKAAGMAVGAYHFCRASNVSEAVREAEYFMSVVDSVGGMDALDIPPILDIETVHANTRQAITAICHAWLETVEKRYKVKPMIYSFPFFIDSYLDPSLSAYPLYFANYSGTVLPDRNGWSEWTFLQYSDRGTVPGIAGPVDLNEYNGTEDDLMGYKLSAEDANYIIERWLAKEYEHASDADQERRHRLANELRKASGQPEQ
jgi:lysozyme